jgi:N-ethylmaleimide reductase
MEQVDNADLYLPLQLGAVRMKHRVVMAPLTRSRSLQPNSVPGDLMLEYYSQRASEGGFIISEATNISLTGRGWFGAPGLYSEEQVLGWRKVVDAVHARGGIMFAQLWHTGRVSHVQLTGGATPVTASVDATFWQNPNQLTSTPTGWIQPSPHRALDVSEIPSVIEDYRRAAQYAKQAGFDGVELHGANGYLIDQFLQDGSNKRTDRYGGSIENRLRLALEVIEAMVSVWGGSRVGMRIGPEGTFNAMSDTDSVSLFNHLAEALNPFNLAYLHIIEPRVRGNVVIHENQRPIASERLRRIFEGRLIAAGGFEPSSANSAIKEGVLDAVAFGRYFVSNPDLPQRVREKWPLAAYDRKTFYTFGANGYTDYPRYQEAAVR